MKTSLLLTNCRLAFSDFMVPGAVLLENGTIARLWLDEQPSGISSVRELDCGGLIVAPGLVDIHNHGGLTHDFVAADASGNNIALDFHAQHGVTAMLATVMTETHEQMSNALRLLAEQKKAGEICPNFLGIHVEGPYFHPDKRGAHKLECLRDPMRSERFWEVSDGFSEFTLLRNAIKLDGVLPVFSRTRLRARHWPYPCDPRGNPGRIRVRRPSFCARQ